MKEYIFPIDLTDYFKQRKDGCSIFELMKNIVDNNPDKYYMKWDNITIMLIERGKEKFYHKIDGFMNPCYGEYIKESKQ